MITEFDFVASYMGLHLSGAYLPVPVCTWVCMGRRNEAGLRSVGYGLTFGRYRAGVMRFLPC